MSDSLDRQTALLIIHSLAESGQPPRIGASYLNVGTDRMIESLRDTFLRGVLKPYDGQDGMGGCRWVEANYGNGKTQFLRCVQEVAWQEDYVTAFVELSADECPLDRPEMVYAAVARAIQAPPKTPADVDRGRGIEVMLQHLLDRKFQGVLSGTPNDELKSQAAHWVEKSLGATPVESTGFRSAVVQLLLGKLNGDSRQAELAAGYLRDDQQSQKDLKKIGLHEKLNSSNGFRFLRSLCQVLQRNELAVGTALLFDEARSSLSLMSSRSQERACENLLTVINRCNDGTLPGTLFLYAVMPEFFESFVPQYPALRQRCSTQTRINLENLDGLEELELLKSIGGKITHIFRIAYEDATQNEEILSDNLDYIARGALKHSMVGSGMRRLLVSSWVRALQQLRGSDQRRLSEEEAERIVAGQRIQLQNAEAKTVAAEGE